jgi:hypothetical protein
MLSAGLLLLIRLLLMQRCDGERPCCKTCMVAGSKCKYDRSGVVFTPNQTPESFVIPGKYQIATDRTLLKIFVESEFASSSSRDGWKFIPSDEFYLNSSSATSTPGDAVPIPQISTRLNTKASNEWNSQLYVSLSYHYPRNNLRLFSRMIFLDHRLQLGLYFSYAKQQAIGLGDLSGSSVPSFFIWTAQLFGCYFYRMRERFTSNQGASDYWMQMEVRNLQAVIASLSSMAIETTSSIDLIRAYAILATYYLYTNNFGEVIRYLANAKDIVERENILFEPTHYSTPSIAGVGAQIPWQEFADEMHEKATTLALLIFVDTISGTSDQQAQCYTQLARQFKLELPACLVQLNVYRISDTLFVIIFFSPSIWLTQFHSKYALSYYALEVLYYLKTLIN